MFPQIKWSSGLLLSSVLVALLLTAQADDTHCNGEQGAELCVSCAGLAIGISTEDCCSDYKLYKKCEKCITDGSGCNAVGNENKATGRTKRESLWKNDDELEEDSLNEDKRAKYFLGKRAKYFLGKRSDGYDEADALMDFPGDMDEEKRAKYFLGKRAKYFLGKRAKYFLGKRSDGYDDDDQMAMDRRAKYFLGKRAKYFLGKRDDDKRAKYFLGKRFDDVEIPSEEKRQKYFLGKRSTDNVAGQEMQ